MSAPTPPSPGPGVGFRRKKVQIPRLPASAFSPPSSGTSDAFPLAPSPSAVHPNVVIDANVITQTQDISLSVWKKDAGEHLSGRSGGIVVSLVGPEADIPAAIEQLKVNNTVKILSIAVPFNLDTEVPATPPSYFASANPLVSLSTTFVALTDQTVPNLRWALEQGRPVDIDIHVDLTNTALEGFEDLLTKATGDLANPAPIILSNILPPPHDLTLPIVQLMKHPTYSAFQKQIAALSLFPHTFIKFLPPSWQTPTPPTPLPGSDVSEAEIRQKREWKRRIKMYLGPILEAFGYERIIFGTSPSLASHETSHSGDWYQIARESLAELAVDQEAIDAVFFKNAQSVYGPQAPAS